MRHRGRLYAGARDPHGARSLGLDAMLRSHSAMARYSEGILDCHLGTFMPARRHNFILNLFLTWHRRIPSPTHVVRLGGEALTMYVAASVVAFVAMGLISILITHRPFSLSKRGRKTLGMC